MPEHDDETMADYWRDVKPAMKEASRLRQYRRAISTAG
jgi:hypothetical protein